VCVKIQFAQSGCAALLCGKASPFRQAVKAFILLVIFTALVDGKAKPFRTAGRQSRFLASFHTPLTYGVPGQAQTASSTPASGDYLISPDDLLDVSVFDVPEMSRTYRVHPNGSIDLPLVPEPITAAGLTTEQLSAAIGSRLRADGLVSEPQVSVEVKESRLHSVVVTGEVKKPQIYPIFGETRLLDVLAQAEGLTEDAGDVAIVTRGSAALRASGGSAQADDTVPVDLKRLMATNDPKLNVVICPGDRITVQRAGIVYVVGAVNRPGGFVMNAGHQPMTVLKAVALAEDLKPTALGNRALIIRSKVAGASPQEQAPVRLKDILSGHAPDQPLLADEILFVPDSTSQRALRRAAEAAVQAATGVIIWRLP
jgi:polysaccharide biosynthesis/export protein